ncbi:transglutaminase [Amycolatopsis antarctica]|uniref:Transglutaminase n=1 Tax=Amycolatopsis antarctica TaxID=1854586 RepID=A0A263D806_9PSEU|nr:transglutaminase family protein [Amycolatopsis antarctica]OZM74573.1 transglutaminase [Amycolatopsis antarctica]
MTVRSHVSAELVLRITSPGRLAMSVAVAGGPGVESERLTISGPSGVPEPIEFPHRTRVHVLDLPLGEVTINYSADCAGRTGEPERVTEADAILYTRPSRYCPSDRLMGLAAGQFGRPGGGRGKIDAIVDFVGSRLFYTPGSSRPTDDAVNTVLAGEGVCRDYAHLCIAFCRAQDIPARFVAVYAPGLRPMDFHAVFEAAVDGHWYAFDATRLAPRASLTRIATGRDASDTAFLSTLGSELDLLRTTVSATATGELPVEDPDALVSLA